MKARKFILKLSLAAVILWFVWDKFDFGQLRMVLTNPALLAVIPACWLANQALTMLRLHSILQALGRPTRLSDVVQANMSSALIGSLIPGVIGTDVVKFFYLKKHDPEIPHVQLGLILVIDRMLGLLAVVAWCSFFSLLIIVNDDAAALDGSTKLYLYLPFALLIVSGVGLSIIDVIMRFLSRFNLPSIASDSVRTYRQLIQSYNRKSLALLITYNLSAVFVLLAGLVFIGGKLQIQQHGEAMATLQFFLIPLVLIASMLPLTPMGMGVAQVTMASAYNQFGLDSSVGVSISTLSQLGLLVVSVLFGGSFFLWGRDVKISHCNPDSPIKKVS
jgi:uncharacterized protein (TIRG00374 family)